MYKDLMATGVKQYSPEIGAKLGFSKSYINKPVAEPRRRGLLDAPAFRQPAGGGRT